MLHTPFIDPTSPDHPRTPSLTCVYTTISPSPTRVSRRDRVYAALKQDLLAGRFPLGDRLAEEQLAARFDVSRTPVREAIQRLHAEGLAEPHDDGGFRPRVPDMVGIRELYEVRLALEIQALRRPGELGMVHDAQALRELERRWQQLADEPPDPDPSFVAVDETFHVTLAAAAGNRELTGMLQAVNERIRAVRMHDFLTPDRLVATIHQHLGIVRDLRSQSAGIAVARLTVHLTDSMAVVEARAAAALVRMTAGANPGADR